MTADGMTPQAEVRGNVGEPYSLTKVLGIWHLGRCGSADGSARLGDRADDQPLPPGSPW